MDALIIHYGELALKGGNRDFFEQTLIDNIRKQLDKRDYTGIHKLYGRILLNLKEGCNQKRITAGLKHIFGIENFVFAYKTVQDPKRIAKDVFQKLPQMEAMSFAVKTHRGNKNLAFKSPQVNKEVSGYMLEHGFKAKVDLQNPTFAVYVELFDKSAYFYFEKNNALGGMPSGTAGKVVTLLSSGYDSPVAAYQIMRRGAKCVFLHFHSYPYTNQASQENVKEIVKMLEQYQGQSKLYMIPFADIQKEIMTKAPAKLRIVLYRRYMLRIAEIVARREKAEALVTGDSLAQVASQTLRNMRVISQAAILPILRPLVGMDKRQIIDISRELGLYEICSRPYDDCCSMFTPKNPETHAKLEEVIKAEEGLLIEPLLKELKFS